MYVNIYPGFLSLYISFYDLSVDLINRAVSLFRTFFVRFYGKIDLNLSYWQNTKKCI